MFRKLLLPAIALGMLLFAILHVVQGQTAKPKLEPPSPPARTPYAHTVAATGLVEAQTENIAVGSYVPGIVVEVYVKVGDTVAEGARLFRLDDRPLRAELAVRKAALAAAEAQLAKLDQMPRPEEVPPSKARLREAEANFTDWEDQRLRAERLFESRTIGEEELTRRRQSAGVAREQMARARAELSLLEAGAWKADKSVTQASIDQMAAQVRQTETDLERLEVRALVAGEVLKVDIRPGEYVGAPPDKALVVLGNVTKLHVRVDVDEHDIPRFRPEAHATAALRGDPRQTYALHFVRVEPYVLPKKSLTGDNTERVDTRVLQVIYAVERRDGPRLFVGQQVDVFIEYSGR